MIIIKQPWEKENLNVISAEFKFDSKDKVEQISEEILSNEEYDYQVCRVPMGRMDIVYLLQHNGFLFSEVNYELVASLKNQKLPSLYERIFSELSYHIASDIETEKIFQSIYAGVFDTDRIILDPYFKKEQSGIRFANWAKQEIIAGNAIAYIVCNNNEEVGFFILKNIDKHNSYSLLAALFDKNDLGIGISTIYYPMLQASKEGKRKIIAGVSSNNPNSLKVHLSLGYEIKNMNYLLVKHTR